MTVLSPDVEMVIEAIKEIDPKYNLSENSIKVCMRDAIGHYSPEARTLCVGQNDDFCRGVLLALQLSHSGVLPSHDK